MAKWRSLDTLPPDRTIVLRIIEKITGEPVWAKPAYVDEALKIHALDGNDRHLSSHVCAPSHWMDMPSTKLSLAERLYRLMWNA